MPERDDAGGSVGTRDAIRKQNTLSDVVIYDSSQRGSCYHCIRVLWCGCCEPFAHISTKVVKENRWEGCAKKSDTMAFENITDVRRQQTCCCLVGSFLPCCCCIDDMGDLVLFGSDASENKKQNEHADKWILKRISNSFDTFEKITGHLQELHADWRKVGRNIGRKLGQVKE